MAETSGIEWTDATVNFWWGCTKVGPGCDWCYAESWAKRTGGNLWGVGVPRRKIKGARALILKLQNGYSWFYADYDRRRRVFIQSMSDLFDTEVPIEWLAEGWDLIELCSNLEIQIVTKRVSVVEKRLAAIGKTFWPKNAGLIISVVNQAEADRDIPRLIELKHRLGIPWIGLSMEPLLGAAILKQEWLAELGWVIVGGESGSHARIAELDWIRSLRDQCATSEVPFMFKQFGEWIAASQIGFHGHERKPRFDIPPQSYVRVGKKVAGRLLDGVEHNGFPV